MSETSFSVQQIKFEFLSYIKEFDLDAKAWRIGMAEDAAKALFADNAVDEKQDIWLWKPALSAAAARLVYTFFVERFGITPATTQDPGNAGRCVFLFRRSVSPASACA